jgi:DNA-binding transcriptional regulator YiaG
MATKHMPAERMSSQEFKDIRNDLGLSVPALAQLLNLSNTKKVRRYEDGDKAVSGPAGVLMRVLRDVPGALEYVEKLSNERHRAHDL